MSIRKRINKHRNWAVNAMKYNKEARNDDWELLFTTLALNGVVLNEAQKFQIKESGINYHTLLRERQRIQSSGQLLPTNKTVLEKRKLAEKEYKDYYSENKQIGFKL